MKAHRGVKVQHYSFPNLEVSCGGQSAPRPGRFIFRKERRYLFYRRLGGTQGRSGRVRKTSLPLGFHPRTVRPVAGRCTAWAIPATPELADHQMTRTDKHCSTYATYGVGTWFVMNRVRILNSHSLLPLDIWCT